MKPAPPVMKILRGSKAIQHLPQVMSPVAAGCVKFASCAGSVQNAEARPPGPGRIKLARNGRNPDRMRQQPEVQAFITDCDGEIVPTCYPQIAPMIDSALRAN